MKNACLFVDSWARIFVAVVFIVLASSFCISHSSTSVIAARWIIVSGFTLFMTSMMLLFLARSSFIVIPSFGFSTL